MQWKQCEHSFILMHQREPIFPNMQAPACWGDGVQLTHITEFISTFFTVSSCHTAVQHCHHNRQIHDGSELHLQMDIDGWYCKSVSHSICAQHRCHIYHRCHTLYRQCPQATAVTIHWQPSVGCETSIIDLRQTSLHSLEQHLRQFWQHANHAVTRLRFQHGQRMVKSNTTAHLLRCQLAVTQGRKQADSSTPVYCEDSEHTESVEHGISDMCTSDGQLPG